MSDSAPQVSAMECPLGVKQTASAREGAGKLDGGFNALAAGAGKEDLGKRATRPGAELGSQLAGEVADMALQHHRPAAVQFVLERGDDARMIVTGVVNAVAREEIEDAGAVGGKELRAHAAVVLGIHLQKIEQPDPMRIDVIEVGEAAGIGSNGRQKGLRVGLRQMARGGPRVIRVARSYEASELNATCMGSSQQLGDATRVYTYRRTFRGLSTRNGGAAGVRRAR
jgi:hypothetical protein